MTPLNIIYNLISRPSLPPPLSLSLRFAIADAALRVSDIAPDVLPPARAGAGAWHGPSCQRLELHYRTNRSRRKRRADELPDLDKTGDEEDWNRQRAPALSLARSLVRAIPSSSSVNLGLICQLQFETFFPLLSVSRTLSRAFSATGLKSCPHSARLSSPLSFSLIREL